MGVCPGIVPHALDHDDDDDGDDDVGGGCDDGGGGDDDVFILHTRSGPNSSTKALAAMTFRP